MNTTSNSGRNKWTFLRKGIKFNDDHEAGLVFRFVDIMEVFHFTWDVTMMAYLPYQRWMKMPEGAEVIRIHSSDPHENWCWGNEGRLMMYKAWRKGVDEKNHCYVYIYNLEDATVHRYQMPENVHDWEWRPDMNGFVVMAGNLNFTTRKIENQEWYIIPAPAKDAKRTGRLDVWVELVDEPTPQIISGTLLKDSCTVDGGPTGEDTSMESESLMINHGKATDYEKTRGRPERFSKEWRIGSKKDQRKRLVYMIVASVILLTVLIIKIVRGIM